VDSNITLRFFKVVPIGGGTPDFSEALKGAFEAGKQPKEREKTISLSDGRSAIVRIENWAPDNTFVDVEVVRRQQDNLPPEVNDDGLDPLPLPDGSGLGHSIALRYHEALSILCIQLDTRKVSVGLLLAYLRDIDPTWEYRAEPLVNENSWERYDRGSPRKVALKIASPTSLPHVEGDVGAVSSSAKRLGNLYGAPIISVEISMGQKSGSLIKDKVDSLLRYFTNGDGSNEDIRKLSVSAALDDGAEEINFLNDLISVKAVLDLPRNEPKNNYEKRKNWIKTSFNDKLEYIRNVYGED